MACGDYGHAGFAAMLFLLTWMPNSGLVVAPLKLRSRGNQVDADPALEALDKELWVAKDLQWTTHPLATKAQYFENLSRKELKAFAIGSSASLAIALILIGTYCCFCPPRAGDEDDYKDPDCCASRRPEESPQYSKLQEEHKKAMEKGKEDWNHLVKESKDKDKLLEAKNVESKQMSNRLAALEKGKEEWTLREDLLMKSSRDKDKLLEAKCAEVKQMASALEKAKEEKKDTDQLLEGKCAEAEKMSNHLAEITKREEHLERELSEMKKWHTMPAMSDRPATPEDLESLFAKRKPAARTDSR
jgi:hypothetical protein